MFGIPNASNWNVTFSGCLPTTRANQPWTPGVHGSAGIVASGLVHSL
jgi:hypothetical protein